MLKNRVVLDRNDTECGYITVSIDGSKTRLYVAGSNQKKKITKSEITKLFSDVKKNIENTMLILITIFALVFRSPTVSCSQYAIKGGAA